jgi:hypothetical protein
VESARAPLPAGTVSAAPSVSAAPPVLSKPGRHDAEDPYDVSVPKPGLHAPRPAVSADERNDVPDPTPLQGSPRF